MRPINKIHSKNHQTSDPPSTPQSTFQTKPTPIVLTTRLGGKYQCGWMARLVYQLSLCDRHCGHVLMTLKCQFRQKSLTTIAAKLVHCTYPVYLCYHECFRGCNQATYSTSIGELREPDANKVPQQSLELGKCAFALGR